MSLKSRFVRVYHDLNWFKRIPKKTNSSLRNLPQMVWIMGLKFYIHIHFFSLSLSSTFHLLNSRTEFLCCKGRNHIAHPVVIFQDFWLFRIIWELQYIYMLCMLISWILTILLYVFSRSYVNFFISNHY